MTFDNTTDATYRAWVNVIHNQLSALGWVQTSDTGQINLSTATRSQTAGTNYEIWRTNDGGTTLYMKIEYVSTLNSGKQGIAITVGQSTDGAGNITGSMKTVRMGTEYVNPSAQETSPTTCYISGDASRIACALNVDAVNTYNTICFGVERVKDANGADITTGGFMVAMWNGGASVRTAATGVSGQKTGFSQYVANGTGPGTIEVGGVTALIGNASTGTQLFSNEVPFSLWVPNVGHAQNPGLNWLFCVSGDAFPAGNTGSILVYGANHTYIGVGANVTQPVAAAQVSVANTRMMMRYE